MVHWALSRFIHEPRNIVEVCRSQTFGQCGHKHVTYPTEAPHPRHGTCHLVAKRTQHLACWESLRLRCLKNQLNGNNKDLRYSELLDD